MHSRSSRLGKRGTRNAAERPNARYRLKTDSRSHGSRGRPRRFGQTMTSENDFGHKTRGESEVPRGDTGSARDHSWKLPNCTRLRRKATDENTQSRKPTNRSISSHGVSRRNRIDRAHYCGRLSLTYGRDDDRALLNRGHRYIQTRETTM